MHEVFLFLDSGHLRDHIALVDEFHDVVLILLLVGKELLDARLGQTAILNRPRKGTKSFPNIVRLLR